MNSYNRVEFKGTIGKDALVKNFDNNSLARIDVATDFQSRQKDGTYSTETTWLNVVVWKGFGIPDFSLLKKGTRVAGVGRLRNRKYTDAQGINKEAWEVVATELDIIAPDIPMEKMKEVAREVLPPKPQYSAPNKNDEDLPF